MQSSNKNHSEKRVHLRVPLRVLKVGSFESGRDIFFGYAQNLSLGGMYIQTSNPKDIGEELKKYLKEILEEA